MMILSVNLMDPIVQETMFTIFENEDEITTKDLIVWIKTNEKIGKEWSLKLLTVTWHKIPIT